MPSHAETRILPYSPEQMFALVADVARYREFLPWCRASRVLERTENGFLGELVIAYKGLSESYTSQVTLSPVDANGVGAIHVEMVRGPFHHLTNHWRFSPSPDGGTRIDFSLDFRFKNRLLEGLMGGFFSKATEKMVGAFEARAQALYGKD